MIKSNVSKILIVLLLFPLCLGAQNNVLDSLFIQLEQSGHDSTRISLLNKIAYNYHRVDIDSTQHYANLALAQSKKYGYKKGESRALNLLGVVASFKGENNKMVDLNIQSYEIANELNSNYLIALSCNGLSIGYDVLNNTEQSIHYGKIALEAAMERKDTFSIIYILSNLFEFHYNAGNYISSSKYADQVIELAEKTEDCRLISVGYQNQGRLQYAQNELVNARKSFDYSMIQAKKCNDEYFASLNYYWISQIHFKNKEYIKAKKEIDRSNKILDKIGGREQHLDSYDLDADILLKLGRKEDALKELLAGYEKSKKANQLKQQENYLSKLGNYHKDIRDFETAYKYMGESKILKDSMQNLNKAVSMLELERKYNLEKKEVEVQLLQEQKSKDAQIIKSRSYFIIASTLFAMLIGVIAFYTLKNLRKEEKYNSELESNVKERTKELEQSNEMLHKSNEELERFAYISSHDLKQPLKNMISFTKLIKDESIKSNLPKITEYSNILENCSIQLNTLVSDILDYSTVKNDFQMQNVDLNIIVDQLRGDLKETIISKNAVIKSDQLPNIKSDKSQMYQAFKNIIENGIKYNKSETPQVNISAQENGTSWKIKFEDNGIGIDPEYHEHIFQMFKRLHNKDEYPGSGIGLSTVKTIVSKLNGQISVDSNLDTGSEFTITIPKLSA